MLQRTGHSQQHMCMAVYNPAGKFLTSACSTLFAPSEVYPIRNLITRGFCPCILFFTCNFCMTAPELFAGSVLPVAGSSRNCMNLGTAACTQPFCTSQDIYFCEGQAAKMRSAKLHAVYVCKRCMHALLVQKLCECSCVYKRLQGLVHKPWKCSVYTDDGGVPEEKSH